MKKLLYILNFARRLNQFSHSSMLAAQSLGYEFHVGSHWSYASEEEKRQDEEQYGIKIHQIDFVRNPLHPGNYKAYRQLCRLMERERFQIVHCNTPIGGVLGRLAAKRYNVNAVIYQAHGFHFYQGAPWTSWLLYYPIEKWMAQYTDCIITINHEDYALASNKLHPRQPGKVLFVPGIGIDVDRYARAAVDTIQKRKELGIPENAMLAISVGELNRNKNHEVILRAIASIPQLHYAIAGIGHLHEHLVSLAKELQILDRVHFLGFRGDIPQVYRSADIFCLPSYREGLSASLMEGMAAGLPVVCSDIRGNRDLVTPQGGYLIKPQQVQEFSLALADLASSAQKRARMGKANQVMIQAYDIQRIVSMVEAIYLQLEERLLKEVNR